MIRETLYVIISLSFIFALFLVGFGVVQTFSKSVSAITLEGNTQIIPLGPGASQVAIKQLGTNGGGYLGVNASHPFENPSPISNFLQMFSILILPGACVFFIRKNNRKYQTRMDNFQRDVYDTLCWNFNCLDF